MAAAAGVGEKVRAGRRYHFTARHTVEGATPPWNAVHVHAYTVEIIGEGELGGDGFAVPMDAWDAELEGYISALDRSNLNDEIGGPTTVEALAQHFLGIMEWEEADSNVVEVRVQEDDDRWASAVYPDGGNANGRA